VNDKVCGIFPENKPISSLKSLVYSRGSDK